MSLYIDVMTIEGACHFNCPMRVSAVSAINSIVQINTPDSSSTSYNKVINDIRGYLMHLPMSRIRLVSSSDGVRTASTMLGHGVSPLNAIRSRECCLSLPNYELSYDKVR